MSFKPTSDPPYPYYQRGISRPVKKQTLKRKGRKKRSIRGVYRRERAAEEAFKFGQIRSGVEGLATYRGTKKPSREQVATDFFEIHKSALINKARDDAYESKLRQEKVLKLEEKKQSFFEQNAEKQLQLQERAIKDQKRQSGRAFQDRARMERMIGDVAGDYFRTHREGERRAGEREERMERMIGGVAGDYLRTHRESEARAGQREQRLLDLIERQRQQQQQVLRKPHREIQDPFFTPGTTFTSQPETPPFISDDPSPFSIEELQPEPERPPPFYANVRPITQNEPVSIQFADLAEQDRQAINRGETETAKLKGLKGLATADLHKSLGGGEKLGFSKKLEGQLLPRDIQGRLVEGQPSPISRGITRLKQAVNYPQGQPDIEVSAAQAETIENKMGKVNKIVKAIEEQEHDVNTFKQSKGMTPSSNTGSLGSYTARAPSQRNLPPEFQSDWLSPDQRGEMEEEMPEQPGSMELLDLMRSPEQVRADEAAASPRAEKLGLVSDVSEEFKVPTDVWKTPGGVPVPEPEPEPAPTPEPEQVFPTPIPEGKGAVEEVEQVEAEGQGDEPIEPLLQEAPEYGSDIEAYMNTLPIGKVSTLTKRLSSEYRDDARRFKFRDVKGILGQRARGGQVEGRDWDVVAIDRNKQKNRYTIRDKEGLHANIGFDRAHGALKKGDIVAVENISA